MHRMLVPYVAYPNWEHCAIRKTAYIENLYVRIEDGEEYDDFEIDFGRQFETPAKPILDKVCNGQNMTPENWRVLCDYITAQYVRTPSFYYFISRWGVKSVPGIIDTVVENLVKTPPNRSAVDHQENGGELLPLKINLSKTPVDTMLEINTVVGKNLWLYTINYVLASDSNVKQTFHNMKWSIASAPSGIIWPTCDAPVVIAEFDHKRNMLVTNGLWGSDRVIIFSISPSKVLLGMHKRKFAWRFEADRNLAEQIKKAIVNNALMYVYSSFADPEIEIIRSRMVNIEEFQRLQNEYHNWYNMYKDDEAPLLVHRR